jgi:hypothetical protein
LELKDDKKDDFEFTFSATSNNTNPRIKNNHSVVSEKTSIILEDSAVANKIASPNSDGFPVANKINSSTLEVVAFNTNKTINSKPSE